MPSSAASAPFTFNLPAFFTYAWTGGEPRGEYLLFIAAVKPGAFEDDSIDGGDIVALSTATVCLPSGGSFEAAD